MYSHQGTLASPTERFFFDGFWGQITRPLKLEQVSSLGIGAILPE
jgi:hypothetical protein